MTLRAFLDAAYAILVAEYQRMGSNLTDAFSETAMWRSGGKKEVVVEQAPNTGAARRANRAAENSEAVQNEQALQLLQTMMAGVGRV